MDITNYFTDSYNKVGGNTKDLVVLPPMEGIQPKDTNKLTLSRLDDIADNAINSPKGCEFSITFKEMYRKLYTDKEIRDILCKYLKIHPVSYILYPEYGNNIKLHYHGVAWGTMQNLRMMKDALQSKFGRTEIKGIQYTESYFKYIKKERPRIGKTELLKLIIFKMREKDEKFNLE